jgi:mRNA interferase RelE/StbE
MGYKIQIPNSVVKEIKKIPERDRKRIVKAIEDLSREPLPHDTKKLKGFEFYRIRVGDYRIIYSVENSKLVILIIKVAHRREVYR